MSSPTKKEMEEALEKSAKYLAERAAGPTDAHPGPTTPTKAEIADALEKSAQYLESQGRKVTRDGYEPAPAAATPTPVTSRPADSPPIDDSRDKSADSPPQTDETPKK